MIKFNEILSTSQNIYAAENFAVNAIFEITMKKFHKEQNSRLLTARNAMLIENINDVPGEEEVIFPSEIKITIPLFIKK